MREEKKETRKKKIIMSSVRSAITVYIYVSQN